MRETRRKGKILLFQLSILCLLLVCGCTGVEVLYTSMQAGQTEEQQTAVAAVVNSGGQNQVPAGTTQQSAAPADSAKSAHADQANPDNSLAQQAEHAHQDKGKEPVAANLAEATPVAVHANVAASDEPSGAKAVKPNAADRKNGKLVALTFDDGPDTKYTPIILDILKKQNVKATFFVVGKQAEAHPDMIKRIVGEGHALGNHSWSHRQMNKLSAADIEADLKKTDKLLESITGMPTTLFRAPYGAVSGTLAQETSKLNLKLVGWTTDTRDWDGSKPEDMMKTVQHQLKPGGIVLMHCFGGKGGNLNNTVEFLPNLIAEIEKQEYAIVTVPELLEAAN